MDAIIFDMDGLLVDSEPLWRQAELEVFHAVGMPLTEEECALTTGLRIDEVVAHWMARRPWKGPGVTEVSNRIMDGVVDRITREALPMPGVKHALDLAAAQGIPLALCSSSSRRVIAAVLDRLQLRERFGVVSSGEDEARGKPDPAIYLSTSRRLGVAPARCVALEDSLNGVRAAKGAGMRCVAVPDAAADRAPFAVADVVLGSLRELAPAHLHG